MSIGDVALVYSSVAAAASLTVQPTGAIEWIIHAIHAPIGTPIEVYVTNGTNATKVHEFPNGGAQHGLMWAITNGYYLTIKNLSASAAYIGVNGKITK